MREQHYYELEHPQYGIWYATSLYKAALSIGIALPYIYKRIKSSNKIKGWHITEINDVDDIPYKWIDKTNEKILANV